MTGYNFVFDREKMVLGWKESDCKDIRTMLLISLNIKVYFLCDVWA